MSAAQPSPSAGPDTRGPRVDEVAFVSTPVPAEPTPPAPDGKPRTFRSSRRPGLTAAGVVVLDLAVSVVAGILSALVTGGFGWLFGVPFVAVSGYTAWESRRSEWWTAVIMPPLAFAAAILVGGFFTEGTLSGNWLLAASMTLFSHLALGAPILLVAELVVGVALLVRWWRSRGTVAA